MDVVQFLLERERLCSSNDNDITCEQSGDDASVKIDIRAINQDSLFFSTNLKQ